jgi:hypothetical protein
MPTWPKNPLIYEINTWVWLEELGRQASHAFTLASVPDREWDRIAALGFDAVWLMGVWERSPAGIRISRKEEGLLSDFRRALPDFAEQDDVGSPYCVRRYRVDAHLGGPEGLAAARKKMARRGMNLILDFVPNHVAPDHPWVSRHPEYFIQVSENPQEDPDCFVTRRGKRFACGRDPYFPPWTGVVQVNAFQQGLRSVAIKTLGDIAKQCDGVRCDMAMLLMNAVFERTWGPLAGPRPPRDYWPEVIPAVKKRHPEFRFLAEAYWVLEGELLQQGFDYCYDKGLYDLLVQGSAENVRRYLEADAGYQERLVRFLENHDEPRAAALFHPQKHRAVAVTVLTLPGARLLHEGQMEGRQVRLPVGLGRRPEESVDPKIRAFYGGLLQVLRAEGFLRGVWRLCGGRAGPENKSAHNLVAWSWVKERARYLIVVNLSDTRSGGWVQTPWQDLRGRPWRLEDVLGSTVYERNGAEMQDQGLYVDLPAWGFHVLTVTPRAGALKGPG